jgi:hypothetical protein
MESMAVQEAVEAPYEFKAFPRMIYHPDGEYTIVNDQEEQDLHIAVGWSLTPAEHSERTALEIKIHRMEVEISKMKGKLAALVAAEEDAPPPRRVPTPIVKPKK